VACLLKGRGNVMNRFGNLLGLHLGETNNSPCKITLTIGTARTPNGNNRPATRQYTHETMFRAKLTISSAGCRAVR
jgi:hypothetical protein